MAHTGMDDYSDSRRKPRPRPGIPSAKDEAQGPTLFGEPPQGSATAPRARNTDPQTSHDAARKAGAGLSKLQIVILNILGAERAAGATDDELIAAYYRRVSQGTAKHKSPQRIRSARKNLVDLRRVKDSGITRPSAMGNNSTVWQRGPRP